MATHIATQQEQVRRYAEWVKKEGGIELPTHLATLFKAHQVIRLNWLRDNCEGRILELGTCFGFVLAYCNGHTGVDNNADNITLARILNPKLEFAVSDIRNLSFVENSFDTVMAPDVLEHVPWGDVSLVLNRLKLIARRFILITVPSESGIESRSFKHQWVVTNEKIAKIRHMFPQLRVDVSQDSSFVYIKVHLAK
ncbi:MAG: class I SAM-dependent methyltransferase [Dehalococcoidales bacterium]|nr:class I SAM-dependent methyltransferase [Dehalococcoidales bacterium]